jgi:hypothetical protein
MDGSYQAPTGYAAYTCWYLCPHNHMLRLCACCTPHYRLDLAFKHQQNCTTAPLPTHTQDPEFLRASAAIHLRKLRRRALRISKACWNAAANAATGPVAGGGAAAVANARVLPAAAAAVVDGAAVVPAAVLAAKPLDLTLQMEPAARYMYHSGHAHTEMRLCIYTTCGAHSAYIPHTRAGAHAVRVLCCRCWPQSAAMRAAECHGMCAATDAPQSALSCQRLHIAGVCLHPTASSPGTLTCATATAPLAHCCCAALDLHCCLATLHTCCYDYFGT